MSSEANLTWPAYHGPAGGGGGVRMSSEADLTKHRLDDMDERNSPNPLERHGFALIERIYLRTINECLK